MKKDFPNLMKSIPNKRLDTINELAEITCSTPSTVYGWMKRGIIPPMLKRKIIADYFCSTVDVLWPPKCK